MLESLNSLKAVGSYLMDRYEHNIIVIIQVFARKHLTKSSKMPNYPFNVELNDRTCILGSNVLQYPQS